MSELKVINHPSGHVEKILIDNSTPDKSEIETQWQDSELRKYDNKLQPDRTNAARILEYRQELREYILQSDFPNGIRPIL